MGASAETVEKKVEAAKPVTYPNLEGRYEVFQKEASNQIEALKKLTAGFSKDLNKDKDSKITDSNSQIVNSILKFEEGLKHLHASHKDAIKNINFKGEQNAGIGQLNTLQKKHSEELGKLLNDFEEEIESRVNDLNTNNQSDFKQLAVNLELLKAEEKAPEDTTELVKNITDKLTAIFKETNKKLKEEQDKAYEYMNHYILATWSQVHSAILLSKQLSPAEATIESEDPNKISDLLHRLSAEYKIPDKNERWYHLRDPEYNTFRISLADNNKLHVEFNALHKDHWNTVINAVRAKPSDPSKTITLVLNIPELTKPYEGNSFGLQYDKHKERQQIIINEYFKAKVTAETGVDFDKVQSIVKLKKEIDSSPDANKKADLQTRLDRELDKVLLSQSKPFNLVINGYIPEIDLKNQYGGLISQFNNSASQRRGELTGDHVKAAQLETDKEEPSITIKASR